MYEFVVLTDRRYTPARPPSARSGPRTEVREFGAIAVTFNHTIIHASDHRASAEFLTELLGLPRHRVLGPFAVVQVGVTSLDFMQTDEEIRSRHFAFQVSEPEFDEIFGRIRDRGMSYWADPMKSKPGEINHWDDGRGVYFDDPDGHLLEILTRPYGSGGLDAKNPNPLLSS